MVNEVKFEEKLAKLQEALTVHNILKGTTRAIAKHSVKVVIAGIVSNLVPTETRKQKIEVAIGTYIICGLVKDRVGPVVDAQFEAFAKELREWKEIFNGDNSEELPTEDPQAIPEQASTTESP